MLQVGETSGAAVPVAETEAAAPAADQEAAAPREAQVVEDLRHLRVLPLLRLLKLLLLRPSRRSQGKLRALRISFMALRSR